MNIKQAASIMSARGASKGGRARAEALSAKQRKQIASAAAHARWSKSRDLASELPYEDEQGDDCDDPHCPCHRFRKAHKHPGAECTLSKPLWMVIPPQGIHLPCPVHGKHFIAGSRIRF